MFPYDKTKLGKPIADGFYAKIYEYGEQVPGKRNHLVKCMPARDITQLRKYQEEFALGFNNKHPFVLNYKGLYTEEVNESGKKYLVYIKMVKMKESLRELIRRTKDANEIVPLKKVIWIFFSLANALSYLEDKDTVHSNIMYDSVFFEENDTVKLGGFAFSRYKPWNRSEGKIYQSYLPPEEGYELPKEGSTVKKREKVEKEEEKDDDQLDKSLDLFDEKIEEKKDEVKEKEKDEKEDKKEDEELNKSFDLFDEKEEELKETKDAKKDEFEKNKKDEMEEKEDKRAAKAVAFKKDVWCLGKLIIDICLLRNEIKREKFIEDINKKVKEDIEAVDKIYHDQHLKRILESVLGPKREDRPTFREIFEDLQKSYSHLVRFIFLEDFISLKHLLAMENKKEQEKQINLDISDVTKGPLEICHFY